MPDVSSIAVWNVGAAGQCKALNIVAQAPGGTTDYKTLAAYLSAPVNRDGHYVLSFREGHSEHRYAATCTYVGSPTEFRLNHPCP